MPRRRRDEDLRLSQGLLEAADTELCERRLLDFVRGAWHVVEPGNPFVDGFHIGLICEHLQAVTDGQIRNLAIAMPPRHAKSLLVCVFWPAWVWLRNPESRWLFASYSESLATRDSLKCKDVVKSLWYQSRWISRFQIRKDDDTKFKFANDKTGYRLTGSVGGRGLGEGGSYIVCLPPDEVVWTEEGPLPIGDIVRQRRQMRAWSFDPATEQVSLQPITGWHTNPGRLIVEVILSDGSSVRCTADHRFWTRNRGWVTAGELQASDVLPRPAGFDVVDRHAVNTVPGGNVGECASISENSANHILRETGIGRFDAAMPVVGQSHVSSFISPQYATPDRVDGSNGDAMSFGQHRRQFSAGCNGPGGITVQFSPRALGTHSESAVPLGISDVVGACAVGEVAQDVVEGIAVEMANLTTFGAWANECQHDTPMNEQVITGTVDPRVEARITIGAVRSLDDATSHTHGAASCCQGDARLTTDAAEIRHTVKASVSGDRTPLLVRHAGYSEKTYCLTVDVHHTMLAGSVNSIPIVIRNCDDANKPSEVGSDIIRKQVQDWWDKTMSTRLSDPTSGRKVIIQQRLHEGDLIGHVMSTDRGYELLCLPARYRPTRVHMPPPPPKDYGLPPVSRHPTPAETQLRREREADLERDRLWEWRKKLPPNAIIPTTLQRRRPELMDPRTEEGQLLWPQRFGHAEIKTLEMDLGPWGAAAQLDQDPVPAGGGIFKQSSFRYFRDEVLLETADGPVLAFRLQQPDGESKLVMAGHCRWFQTADTALKATQANDWTAIPTVAITPDNELLVFDMFRERVEVPKQFGVLVQQRMRYPQLMFQAVEDKNSGTALIQQGMEKGVPFRVLKASTDKVQRSATLAAMAQNGMLYFLAGATWLHALEQELMSFPQGTHDDMVDALAYAALLVMTDNLLIAAQDVNDLITYPATPEEIKEATRPANWRDRHLNSGWGGSWGDDDW